MLSKIFSGAILGLNALSVEVEVDVSEKGLPAFRIVGLPDKAIEEAKERVRSGLLNSMADFPARRITVNLTPADLPKEGPAYDFPIAVGILLASDQIPYPKELYETSMFLGELSLDGSLRYTPGVLPLVLHAKDKGYKNVFLPQVNAKEASVVKGVDIYPVKSLRDYINHIQGLDIIPVYSNIATQSMFDESVSYALDFQDILGQENAKRALIISAAGGHNVLMYGPAGSGKTLLARSLPSILPAMTVDEGLEVTKIYSISGKLGKESSLIKQRPFCAPHHTVSRVGLIGGGSNPMPGDISLAHRGVLFLDEFPEYPRNVLEALRQPLEDGVVSISRAKMNVTYPAKFTLIAAMNPCPCGNFGEKGRVCTCTPHQVSNYHKRISGPLEDRIDLHVNVPSVQVEKLQDATRSGETSESIRERVQLARNRQLERFEGNLTCNAEMSSKDFKKYYVYEDKEACMSLLKSAVEKYRLSARSYYKILKLALTIADLEGEDMVNIGHISEALQYRPREQSF